MDISNLSVEQLKAVRRMAWLAECQLDSWAKESERPEDYLAKAQEMYQLWDACTTAIRGRIWKSIKKEVA